MRILAGTFFLAGCVLLLSAQGQPAQTAEPATSTAAAPRIELSQVSRSAAGTTAARKKPSGRLPRYFGKLGVSDEQRTKIYELQAKYAEQIEALEKELAALKDKRDGEIAGVLTAGQKTRLTELREAASRKSSSRSASGSRSAE